MFRTITGQALFAPRPTPRWSPLVGYHALLKAFPPSATRGRAILCWHGPIHHGFVTFRKANCWQTLSAYRSCVRLFFQLLTAWANIKRTTRPLNLTWRACETVRSNDNSTRFFTTCQVCEITSLNMATQFVSNISCKTTVANIAMTRVVEVL